MNLSKHINLRRIAPIFLTVLAVLPFLLNAEKLGRSVLTTKADYTQYDTYYEGMSVISSQWQYDSNTVIYRNFYASPPSYPVLQKRCISVAFNGTTVNNDELEFGVITRQWNEDYTGTALSETSWFPANTEVYVRGNILRNTDEYPTTAYTVFVRRKDGGILTPSSMEASVIMLHNDRQINIEQTTAIPQNWLETTTQSNPTYTTQTTMLTTVDYEQYLSTLTVPVDARPAIAQLDQLINDLWSLHYIPFVVCFALIMGLAIWLLH